MSEQEEYEDSDDEQEINQNFEEEARLIVQTVTLPEKSADRYLLVYNTYKKWESDHKKALSNSAESNLIVYFNKLKVKLKPPTLWSVWSMLGKTLYTKDGINIKNFLDLKALIKNNCKGYRPRKAFALRWDQVSKFMNDASDYTFLAAKVMYKLACFPYIHFHMCNLIF